MLSLLESRFGWRMGLGRRCLWAVLASCALAARVCGQAPPEDQPGYAIRIAGGEVEAFTDSHSDDRFEARLSRESDHLWRLSVRSLGPKITEIWFPYDVKSNAIGGDASDDVLYFPHHMGEARRAALLDESTWEGRDYPGGCFAPLVMLADADEARMIAAANDPPRTVHVAYRRGRMGLRYDVPPDWRSETTLRAIVMTSMAATGRPVWHAPLDAYRSFLHEVMQRSDLYPIDYSDWLADIHGWQNVQLENYRTADLDRVLDHWKAYRTIFPWIQMWGQMSDFYTEGARDAGCCLQKHELHPRYGPLLDRLRVEKRPGDRLGFYSRPGPNYEALMRGNGTPSPCYRFLLEWIEKNRGLGANAYYLDVLGGYDFGPPLGVAKLFGRELPRDSVVEKPVDVYPSAFLISGCLWGGSSCRTAPGQACGDLSDKLPCVSFPRLGRYLLHDRIFFLGESNGDHTSWGNSRGHQYWTERQVFLLGAKFDVMRVSEDEKHPDRLNRALELILGERIRVDWWKRRPVYLDTAGISEAPEGVEVRRFLGRDGSTLLAIDNWLGREGRFRFQGIEIEVPKEKIRVLVNPLEGGR